jgi:phospholipid N-methyltransferase
MSAFLYIKNWFSDPYVASIAPTSRFAIGRVMQKMDFGRDLLILEYGPGTGNITAHLLRHMSAGSKLIAIERNPHLCRVLRQSIRDPRAMIFEDSAENVLDILKSCNGSCEMKADYIISGIPFSLVPKQTKQTILTHSHSILKKGGKFLAYQAFFQLPEFLRKPLNELFPTVHAQYVLPSLPPLLILEAIK